MKQFNLNSVSDVAIRESVAKAKVHHKATGEHVQVMKAGLCYYVQKENPLHGKTIQEAIRALYE
ncbi:MAG: hypothetical protein Tp178MES00d2C33159851_23 [Prokaryotic dsDNA virus sp.]|nr:MAG: hypothetical protein Tp178MES00d2C33159851_23 [Prokaryotic dsDNA virus sp.]|tara:strand:+ start:82456 stop:82647 length:192 start_codon:yes stop_codon:yes gene_type:complete